MIRLTHGEEKEKSTGLPDIAKESKVGWHRDQKSPLHLSADNCRGDFLSLEKQYANNN